MNRSLAALLPLPLLLALSSCGDGGPQAVLQSADGRYRVVHIAEADWTMGFQSRLTRGWIEPFSDVILVDLAKAGTKRLAVFCPAFVADCLETIEEIGEQGAEDFRAAGGGELRLGPSLNAEDAWADALVRIARDGSVLGLSRG